MTIGFIGLGVMGKPMAKNLLSRGHQLVVHNRSAGAVDELVAMGATRAATPEDVARAARRVFTMLPDSPDVERVLEGEHGVFRAIQPGTILIDTSSITLKAATITLQGATQVSVKAPQVGLQADGQLQAKGATVAVQGSAQAQVKAPVTQVNGDGMLQLKGGVTTIN